MIMEMNARKILSSMGYANISVSHFSLSDVSPKKADLMICGLDVAYQLRDYPRVIVLRNIIMLDELSEKLQAALSTEKNRFFIE